MGEKLADESRRAFQIRPLVYCDLTSKLPYFRDVPCCHVEIRAKGAHVAKILARYPISALGSDGFLDAFWSEYWRPSFIDMPRLAARIAKARKAFGEYHGEIPGAIGFDDFMFADPTDLVWRLARIAQREMVGTSGACGKEKRRELFLWDAVRRFVLHRHLIPTHQLRRCIVPVHDPHDKGMNKHFGPKPPLFVNDVGFQNDDEKDCTANARPTPDEYSNLRELCRNAVADAARTARANRQRAAKKALVAKQKRTVRREEALYAQGHGLPPSATTSTGDPADNCAVRVLKGGHTTKRRNLARKR
jgi:hypothetical protein